MSQLELNKTEFTERDTFFADILLPLPIPKTYTYRVPHIFNAYIHRGSRVIVQFGRKKVLTGIVYKIHNTPPIHHEAKLILELLDEISVVSDLQLDFFDWMASYYMCTSGEVLNVALPSGLKLNSESHVQLNPEFERPESPFNFSDQEEIILNILSKKISLSYTEITKILGIKTIYKILKSLLSKNAILLFEEIKDNYKPKIEKRLKLSTEYIKDEKSLEGLFETLSSFSKQEEILLAYLQKIPVFKDRKKNNEGLARSFFIKSGFSASAIKTLIKKGIMEEFSIILPRFDEKITAIKSVRLSTEQEQVRNDILASFEKHAVTLLHGITGSGKTEIYIDLIQKLLQEGQQVLYLLPEIALTTQIVSRLKKIFGNTIGIYHSRFSDNERVEVWRAVLSGKVQLVVGVRSSVFLPFQDLGFIIVDEEHETSFKQYDPAPRYNARDAAIMLGKMHHARVLLGSATPSIESYYNTQVGKYELISLDKRFGDAILPDFKIVDIRKERKRKQVKGEFSNQLISAIQETLEAKEQVIIFQNRRGYSPFLRCDDCNWIPKCINCSVSLTYHQYKKEIRCHYCGYKEHLPHKCPACSSTQIRTMGFGTEKLEEELSLLFPTAKIQRMDLETTRTRRNFETIIKDFEEGNTDILVGTQMLSKGLDFDHVHLVGIVDLDRMLHFPDFRAHERTFHLSVQVGGRAGRRKKNGVVYIQTGDIHQTIIPKIVRNDFRHFYLSEITERQELGYPPFYRLIKITVKNRDQAIAIQTATQLGQALGKFIGRQWILGPEEPLISRIRNQHLMELMVKIKRGTPNLPHLKAGIINLSEKVLLEKSNKGSRIIFDVDPS
ncbi:MAG: primosomal protein N' [Cyclobacteriaceae bacterium]|nr:primosomal protein N' [Cyclobacteriaceae bacterium]